MTMLEESLRQADRDGELLQRIAAGEEGALSDLYDDYAPLLAALSVRILRSVSDAEEVLEEVFLEVWKSARSTGEVSLFAWLVLKARARSLLRQRAHGSRKHHHAFDPASVTLMPEGNTILKQPGGVTNAGIVEALRSVSKDDQQVLAIALYEGFSIAEMSQMLHRTAGTVSAQLGSALTAVHKNSPWGTISVTSHEEDYFQFCAAYALGVLDGEEASRFEAHLSAPCGICHSDVRGLQESLALVSRTLSASPLSADVKERILFAIRLAKVAQGEIEQPEPIEGSARPKAVESAPVEASEDPPEVRRRRWTDIMGIFVGLLVLVGLAAYVTTILEKVDHQSSFILEQENAIASLTAKLDGKSAVLALLKSPELEMVPLEGLGANPNAFGKLLWDAVRNEAVLQVSHLSPSPVGEEYKLKFVLNDRSEFLVGVKVLGEPDSSSAYFSVHPAPSVDPESIDYVAVVRLRRGGESLRPHEMVLVGTMPKRASGDQVRLRNQRTK